MVAVVRNALILLAVILAPLLRAVDFRWVDRGSRRTPQVRFAEGR